MSNFFEQIYEIVANIPFGKVLSYGQIACYLGSPHSSRMVGWAMHTCPAGLPWHRVIKKSGEIPFPQNSLEFLKQSKLLEGEGIQFLPNGKVDMHCYEWEIDLPESLI